MNKALIKQITGKNVEITVINKPLRYTKNTYSL